MSELNGFIAPLTPTGKSALVPNMPWYYSGTLLTVEYLTDVENVRAILPADLELADEHPGAVAIIWADWQSCSEGGAELLDPAAARVCSSSREGGFEHLNSVLRHGAVRADAHGTNQHVVAVICLLQCLTQLLVLFPVPVSRL